MRRPAGVSTGAATGNGIEEVGTDGIAAPFRHLLHCLAISGNIQETAIPDKSSSSRSLTDRNTATGRVTP